MEQDKPEYEGRLLLPPNGKTLIKKTCKQKYGYLFKASKFGIERLELYDTPDTVRSSPVRIITLENCIKITQKNPTSFSITTKTATYEFATNSVVDLTEWVTALQSVAFPDDGSKITSIEEDNDLYCSSGEGIFSVKLHSSEASVRCGLEPKTYTLVLTLTAIQLKNGLELLYTWPYRSIRRYGHKSGRFMFEAGRNCETGEGTFYLEHSNQHEIYRCLASKMKTMKKLLKGEATASPMLDCGDNQFHAALSMEARSRSPLPPSPTTSTTIHDIDSIQNKPLIMTSEITDFRNLNTKPKPLKPPRKVVTVQSYDRNSHQELEPSAPQYELISKYDEVELRDNAWKTLGLGDVNHTEHITDSMCNDEEETYFSWGDRKRNLNNPPPVPGMKIVGSDESGSGKKSALTVQMNKAPKIIREPSPDLQNGSYDRLNFFGSSSKLNAIKAGYKQIVPPPRTPVALPSPPTFNDYDVVETVMESVRLADDSHLGYALVRKEARIDHQFHNDDPYAVISKPKQV